MAVATVTLRPGIEQAYVEGKYVCDASPSATNINVGFAPSRVELIDATSMTTFTIWTSDMPAGQGLKNVSGTQSAISSSGVTSVGSTDGVNFGFSIGTDAGVQVASHTWTFRAYR